MYSLHDVKFVEDLIVGDDESALSFLESGQVTIHSVLLGTTMTALRVAIESGREKVALALILLGANVDEFHKPEDESSNILLTQAGIAIQHGSASELLLCHRLGASMASVSKAGSSNSWSAVDWAILMRKPACLVCLLDEVNPARPVCLRGEEQLRLWLSPKSGRPAIEIFKVLRTRGCNFEAFSELYIMRSAD